MFMGENVNGFFSPLFQGTKYISRLLPAAAPPGASTAIAFLSKINLVQSKLQVASSSWQVARCQVASCQVKLQVASKLSGQVDMQVVCNWWNRGP